MELVDKSGHVTWWLVVESSPVFVVVIVPVSRVICKYSS